MLPLMNHNWLLLVHSSMTSSIIACSKCNMCGAILDELALDQYTSIIWNKRKADTPLRTLLTPKILCPFLTKICGF